MIPPNQNFGLCFHKRFFQTFKTSYDDMLKPEQINIMIPKAHTMITRIVTGYSIP